MFSNKELISAQKAKLEFVKSIHNWLMETLKSKGKEEYGECFKLEGSSIMCHLPKDYFVKYDIPDDMIVEMKFINKKG